MNKTLDAIIKKYNGDKTRLMDILIDTQDTFGFIQEKAADQILVGMAKGKRRILVGMDVKALDLITRLFPGSYEGPIALLERVLG